MEYFIPSGLRILIRPAKSPDEKSGIIIPKNAKDEPNEGEVIAVGGGETTINGFFIMPTVAVGARVVYSKYGGTEVMINGEKLLVISERDILGTIKKNQEVPS